MNPLTNVKNISKLNDRDLALGNTNTARSWHNMYKDSAWIFIGGLDYELTEGDIICVFSEYGEVSLINLIRDKDTGKSKGYAFLCYMDQRSTILAVDNLNGFKLCGKILRVDHVEQYKMPKHASEAEIQQLGIELLPVTTKPEKRAAIKDEVKGEHHLSNDSRKRLHENEIYSNQRIKKECDNSNSKRHYDGSKEYEHRGRKHSHESETSNKHHNNDVIGEIKRSPVCEISKTHHSSDTIDDVFKRKKRSHECARDSKYHSSDNTTNSHRHDITKQRNDHLSVHYSSRHDGDDDVRQSANNRSYDKTFYRKH